MRLNLHFILLSFFVLADALALSRSPRQPAAVRQLPSKIYYVRKDGGTVQQCSGLVNAPYPGNGINQPCAWDHPFRALPPGKTPRITGGDTLIIRAGSYRMGYGAPDTNMCDAAGAFDCLMSPIPSGPDLSHRTRILGSGWDNGCAAPPELWGAERPWFIVNLTDSSNVELACLEITDHSGCVEFHTGGLACERDFPPYGPWAAYGIYAEDSANVHLHDLNIHGLAAGGVHAGRLADWRVENVRIAGNGSVGWDGDLWDSDGDANSGTLVFRHWTVEWNGCGETYPEQQPTGCWAQSAGGYGDGFATGASGGRWIVEDSLIRYNTSDGLDFLYVSEPGSAIEIRRTLLQGNAGNQIKNFRGPFLLEDSTIVGNCGFFSGKPFTYNVDNCRALGTALAIGLTAEGRATVINNTFTSEGDCLVTAECSGVCSGSESVLLRNNIFQGQTDFLQPFENTCLAYQETFPSDPFNIDYSLINDVKDDLCPGSHDLCGIAPGLVNIEIDKFNPGLLRNSPAIDAGDNGSCTAADQRGVTRPQDGDGDGSSLCDIGAFEFKPSVKIARASIGAQDGWILESAETSNTGGSLNVTAVSIIVGDDAANRQYRGILHFDTAALPDKAIVTAAKLKIKFAGLVGTNPFASHGKLVADIRKPYFGASAELANGDFQALADASAVAAFGASPADHWYSANLNSIAREYVNRKGTTQFRLRFAKDDNNDRSADYIKFYSGNYASVDGRPQLIVHYIVP